MSDNAMKQLVTAIINQAVKDWKQADKQLEKNPSYRQALRTKREISEFFQGDWYTFLCDLNPDYAYQQLEETYV